MGYKFIFFPENGTWGTNYLKCESENVKNTLLSFFIYSENTNSNLCCPLLRSFWQRRVQHKLEFWHDEYTFAIDSGHLLFQFANRLFHAPVWALVHFNGILSKYILKEIGKRNTSLLKGKWHCNCKCVCTGQRSPLRMCSFSSHSIEILIYRAWYEK